MKKCILFILFILQLSCNSDNNHRRNFNDIITQKGDYTYILFDETLQKSLTFKIKVVEIEGQGNIFGVADLNNKVLYQSSIFTTFSSFSKWGIFFDKETYDIWFYSGDLNTIILLKYVDNKYEEFEYIENKAHIPEPFEVWLND